MKSKCIAFLCSFLLASYAYSQIAFEDQSIALGVDIALGNTFLGNGVSFCDFDNDGWDDLTITSSATDTVRFFKNMNGTFQEQTYSGLTFNYETKSVTWVDFDNDGDNDLFVTSAVAGNKLMENIGNMTFQNITAGSGISTSNLYTYGASWGDYNNDGFLDVFLSNRTTIVSNKLYRNNGNGTFNDVTLLSGIDVTPLFSFCSAFVDINNDGHQDLYVINDKVDAPNKLYKNNSDGTFTDISESSGTNIYIDAMSATIGDYNSDGFFDIYVTNNPSGNYFFRNNGDETFTNIAGTTGTTFDSFAWGAAFFDAENDMDLDIYVSGQFDGSDPNLLSAAFYQNNNNDAFTLNTNYFPGDTRESYANAIGDIDNDGLLDVVVINNDDNLFLWKNITANPLNWITFSLTSTLSNKNAIGAKIEISANNQKQYRYTLCGEGYMAQYGSKIHFGVGTNTVLDYVKVNWPSGIEDVIYNVPVNQNLNITEGENTLGTENNSFSKFQVYPNPVETTLHIKSNTTVSEIELINMQGQQIFKAQPNSLTSTFDLKWLSQGIYFVRISNGKTFETVKISKQ